MNATLTKKHQISQSSDHFYALRTVRHLTDKSMKATEVVWFDAVVTRTLVESAWAVLATHPMLHVEGVSDDAEPATDV